jgi:pimeloyl-ACP methyl ester carboxylesterase
MTEVQNPSSEPFRRVTFEIAGGAMAGIAFGPETPNPDVVFLHATGFNARAYRTMLAPLGERFSVLALDLRGHGRTDLPPRRFGYTSWTRHGNDLIALLERHFTAPVTLAGHSMGATAGLLAAAKRPDLIASLALIEPVFLPAAWRAFVRLPLGPLLARLAFPLAVSAARRRARFASHELAARAFAGRGAFKSFSPDMIADYVADGLVEDKRGGFKLACAPAYEAATYCAQRHDPWSALRKVSCPLVVLLAGKRSTCPPAAARRIALLQPNARIAVVEGAGHMLPMQRPDRARAAMETALMLGGARSVD